MIRKAIYTLCMNLSYKMLIIAAKFNDSRSCSESELFKLAYKLDTKMKDDAESKLFKLHLADNQHDIDVYNRYMRNKKTNYNEYLTYSSEDLDMFTKRVNEEKLSIEKEKKLKSLLK